MATLLIIVLLLILIGALPTWPYSERWGYYPSSTLGLVVIVLVVLVLTGRILAARSTKPFGRLRARSVDMGPPKKDPRDRSNWLRSVFLALLVTPVMSVTIEIGRAHV